MSPPYTARKMKRPRPPTPYAPAGSGAATKAETLALELGKTLAGIARKHPACKPTRKDCDSDGEFCAAMQQYQNCSAVTIVGAMTIYFRHIEQAAVLAMRDAPELLHRPLAPEG